jgi:peroxiredoxin
MSPHHRRVSRAALALAVLLVATNTRFARSDAPAAPPANPSPAASLDSTTTTRAVGTTAPDLVFASLPYGWKHLADLMGPNGLVLVLDPTPADLAVLQAALPELERAGIEPVAVARDTDSASWKLVTHGHLTYSVLADPSGSVATAFGVPQGDATWFVLDADRRIREVGQGGVVASDFASRVITAAAEARASAESK